MTRDRKPPAGERRKLRNYKGELAPSVSIKAGESIEGVFQGEKTIELTDQETGADKDVRVFMFRDFDGKPFVILGRTMLDQVFDDVYKAERGVDNAIGLNMKISRGEDEKLTGKRTMGTYSIEVWED